MSWNGIARKRKSAKQNAKCMHIRTPHEPFTSTYPWVDNSVAATKTEALVIKPDTVNGERNDNKHGVIEKNSDITSPANKCLEVIILTYKSDSERCM